MGWGGVDGCEVGWTIRKGCGEWWCPREVGARLGTEETKELVSYTGMVSDDKGSETAELGCCGLYVLLCVYAGQ